MKLEQSLVTMHRVARLVATTCMLAVLTSGSRETCYDRCTCEDISSETIAVLCQLEDSTTLPPFTADNNVFILDLTHNKLVDIPADSFQSFPNLKELILDYNQITGLDNFALRGLENLEKLSLANNKMVDIEPGCFNGNPSLLYLSLRGNPLQVLFDKNLPFLDSLTIEELDLSECELTTIQAKSFNGLEHLQVLNLNHNRMTNLPASVFDHNGVLKKLYLYGIPWRCDKGLVDLLEKYRRVLAEKQVFCLGENDTKTELDLSSEEVERDETVSAINLDFDMGDRVSMSGNVLLLLIMSLGGVVILIVIFNVNRIKQVVFKATNRRQEGDAERSSDGEEMNLLDQ